MKEYALYTDKIRKYAEKMSLEDAVERAICECIEEGILEEFLKKHRAEAKAMSIFEYDEEAVFEIVRKDEYEKGHQEGIIEGKVESILELLEDISTIPDKVRERIHNEKDIKVLNSWLKLAAKAESIDEFVSKM